MDPIIASYDVHVVVRGPVGTNPPTVIDVEASIEVSLEDDMKAEQGVVVSVTAEAERTDK